MSSSSTNNQNGSSSFMDNLRQLFAECDLDRSGSLGRAEFKELCKRIGLNMGAADETFERLDIDKNEQITFDEFVAGFQQYSRTAGSPTTNSSSSAAGSSSSAAAAAATRLSPGARSRARTSPASSGAGHSSPPPMHLGSNSSSPIGSGPNSALHLMQQVPGAGSFDFAPAAPAALGRAPQTAHSAGDYHRQLSLDNVVVYSNDGLQQHSQDFVGQFGNTSGQFGSLLSNSSGSLAGSSQVKTMQDLLDCVQKLQSENQQLTQIFFKDKREREVYISQLGEEFDHQLREVEERAQRRAREELEGEKRHLREMMQQERETLEQHYETLEKISKFVKSPDGSGLVLVNGELESEPGACGPGSEAAGGQTIEKVKSQLEDTFMENRQLKRSLLDTKTDVAMIWKEMEKLKRQYEDKLSSAYEKHRETQSECDHIKQQLSLMKDSNRKLQDASDVITNYITDRVEPVIKVASGCNLSERDEQAALEHLNGVLRANSAANSRRGSILSEYLIADGDEEEEAEEPGRATTNNRLKAGASPGPNRPDAVDAPREAPEIRLQVPPASQPGAPRMAPIPPKKQQVKEQLPEVETGGHQLEGAKGAQAREAFSISRRRESSGSSSTSAGGASSKRQVSANKDKAAAKSAETAAQSGPGAKAAEQKSAKQSDAGSAKPSQAPSGGGIKNFGRNLLLAARSQSDAKQSDKPAAPAAKLAEGPPPRATSVEEPPQQQPSVEPADGPSKATFNVILVGDSFVGKSSFAARFIEGNFVQGLISNCSIDFKTKSYKVDGENYTINLWDTA